jgi:carboxyl-terminal processing protease
MPRVVLPKPCKEKGVRNLFGLRPPLPRYGFLKKVPDTFFLLLVCAAAWFSAGTLPAQVRIPREAIETPELDNVLHVGDQLEQQRRWGEALSHYESALREHPERTELRQRLVLARLHYEVARRYNDHSFVEALNSLTEKEALDLYGEVLLKVDSHYVEPPDWSGIARRGMTAVDVALCEPAFYRQHQVPGNEHRARSRLDDLERVLEARPPRTRHEAREFASMAARHLHHLEGLPTTAVILEFTCAAGASLDAYSAFLTGSQLDEVLSQIEGNFVGLGIELQAQDDALLIVSVISDGPADEAGLHAGDRIVEVDGRSMQDMSTDAAADLLKGPSGSTVEIVVVGPQEISRRVRMRRRRVDVPSIEDVQILEARTGIAYMRLTSFQKTTARDVDAALWKLHRQGMRCLILDLRRNPGGLLTAAVDVADKFISRGSLVLTRGRSTGENFDYQAHLIGTWRLPLIVLIDGDSASASEIFAGAIRDHRRGTIVGVRSYGKGSVQGIFPLSSANAGLRLTTAKFYSPDGRAISHGGVTPDVVVHSVDRPTPVSVNTVAQDPAPDPVLRAALEVARKQL